MRNMNSTFNKKGLIKHIVKVNIFYKEYKERIEIDVIRRQNNLRNAMACYNSKIDWRIGVVKMSRYFEKYGK